MMLPPGVVVKVGHHESARQGDWRASVLTPNDIGADTQMRWVPGALACLAKHDPAPARHAVATRETRESSHPVGFAWLGRR